MTKNPYRVDRIDYRSSPAHEVALDALVPDREAFDASVMEKVERNATAALSCDQKIRWTKREHAEKAGVKLARRDERRGRWPRVRVYKCSECRGYHLTSMPLDVWLRRQPRWRRVLLWLKRLGRSEDTA